MYKSRAADPEREQLLVWAQQHHRSYREARLLGSSYSQLRSALSSESEIASLETKIGRIYFRPRNTDFEVIRQILILGEYDLDKFPQSGRVDQRYRDILASGERPVILDAGANIGIASVWFANRFPEAVLLAVEPDPRNAEIARMNTEHRPNVRVVEAAIGSTPGSVTLEVVSDKGWGTRTTLAEAGTPVMPVSDLIDLVERGKLLIAKIDIEGFESELFCQNTEWVDEAAAIIIEPHDWMLPGGGTSQAFQRALMGRQREILVSGENLIFV